MVFTLAQSPQPQCLNRTTVLPLPDVRVPDVRELVVCCPQCKALETLWFSGDTLMQARRFTQQNGHVYHDCGVTVPCRLYRL